jgi:hypothetical protein
MFWAASLPRKWSIRKIWRSGKYLWILSLSPRALSRSVPNGFSMMIRDSAAIPAVSTSSSSFRAAVGGTLM